MKTDNTLYDLLLRSLDEPLSPHEQIDLNKGLHDNKRLREQQEELLALRATLGQLSFNFSENFSEQVMASIATESHNNNLNTLSMSVAIYQNFKRISAVAAALVLILLGIHWFNDNALNMETITGVAELTNNEIDAYYYLDF